MSSRQEEEEEEEEPGPSGVSREEVLALLGLDRSEDDSEEEDELCNNVMDAFERQRAFQTQLLQQSCGGFDPQTPVGTFEFDLQPLCRSTQCYNGVSERHFTTRLRQTGKFCGQS